MGNAARHPADALHPLHLHQLGLELFSHRDVLGRAHDPIDLARLVPDRIGPGADPPQSAILAVGAARQEPVVREGVLEVATVIRMVLSVDHRPIDGVVAARWMRALTDVVENPLRILV